MEELQPGKAMYGLLRLPINEERTKTIYLTWVPDGVPVTIKGVVHSHVNAIAKILKVCCGIQLFALRSLHSC